MQDIQQSNEMDPCLEEYEYESMFGNAEVFTVETEEGKPLRCMYVGGGFQSATYLGEDRFVLPFEYCKAFDVVFKRNPSPSQILMLGGGGYSYPKHVLTTYENSQFDVVEIDPVITDIARKHFYVAELEELCGDRLRIFTEDGLEFLSKADKCRYEVVINDTFAGTIIDAPLLSDEALLLTKQVMAEGGIYLLNVVVEDDEDFDDATRETALRELERIRAALSRTFANVICNDVEDENFCGSVNHVFAASDQPI